jgi:flagellin-like protein
MGRRGCDSGVSVIVGTLLLILITVVAAAGLALMVSQMQKDEMNRQTHIAAVKNEKIEILNVVFENNQTAWQSDGNNVINSQNWSSVKLTLVNMNIDDVKISGIAINDRYVLNYTDRKTTDTAGGTSRQIYNFTHPLTIRGTKSQDIYIDFISNVSVDPDTLMYYPEPQAFSIHNPQTIKVITTMTNVFENVLTPPNPVMKISTETEDFGVMQRDTLILDGSGSTADNTIVAWYWNIIDASGTSPAGNCADTTNLGVPNVTTGKITRFNPVMAGPLCISLTVKDDIGMNASSRYTVVPFNQRFLPASSLALSWIAEDHILNATISDTAGNRVSGHPVDYVITRNYDENPFTTKFAPGSKGITDIWGNVSYRVCGNGTIRIYSEKLAEKYFSFTENGC